MVQADQMSTGRLFQSHGTAAMKDSIPHGNSLKPVWGVQNSCYFAVNRNGMAVRLAMRYLIILIENVQYKYLTLNDWFRGVNSEFCFLRISMFPSTSSHLRLGTQNSPFPKGPVIK